MINSSPSSSEAPDAEATREPADRLALILGGGGARAAYQAGVLRGIARRFPEVRFPILTGVSAGAINAIHLARHPGKLSDAAADLVTLWTNLTPEQVYDVHAVPLLRNVLNWGARLISGGLRVGREPMRGMVDTEPLRRFLGHMLEPAPDGTIAGIAANISRGSLHAVALSATSYATGQALTWIEGENVDLWQRPQRRSEMTRLTVAHVMASSALPILFPAVKVGSLWFGDGGIRLTAPLSPALHLGATRILIISTRYQCTHAEADTPLTIGYPPPAQVLGMLYNAIFLDMIEEDILRLQNVNHLLRGLAREKRSGMRVVEILVMRPSRDLAKLAREFEAQLPGLFRYLTRGLGTLETVSPDIVSVILFQTDYMRRLVELGEADAMSQADKIDAFLNIP